MYQHFIEFSFNGFNLNANTFTIRVIVALNGLRIEQDILSKIIWCFVWFSFLFFLTGVKNLKLEGFVHKQSKNAFKLQIRQF